jgi:hypothetical protein
MDIRINKILQLWALLLLLASCAPVVPLYQLDPANPNPLAVLETDEITIKLQHLNNQFGHYVFDLEIINKSSKPLDFSPQRVEYYAAPKMFSVPYFIEDLRKESYSNSQLIEKHIFAVNPETIKDFIEQRERGLATAKTIFAIISIGAMVYDGIQDAKDFKKERWTQADVNRSVNRDVLIASSLFLTDVSNTSHEIARQEAYYLPHELFPDMEIEGFSQQRGKIFLPIGTSFRYMRMILPIGEKEYVFDFKRRNAKGKDL